MLLVATPAQHLLSSYCQGYQHEGRDFVRDVRHVVWDPHVICGVDLPEVCSFLKVNYVGTRIDHKLTFRPYVMCESFAVSKAFRTL